MVMPMELSMESDGNKLWTEATVQYKSALMMVYIASKKSRRDHYGYTIPDSLADALFSTVSLWMAARMPRAFPRMAVDKLLGIIYSTFLGSEV